MTGAVEGERKIGKEGGRRVTNVEVANYLLLRRSVLLPVRSHRAPSPPPFLPAPPRFDSRDRSCRTNTEEEEQTEPGDGKAADVAAKCDRLRSVGRSDDMLPKRTFG